MSKTFKSDNERDKTLGIDALGDRIRLEIEDRKHLIAIIIDNSQAAALALAILEAAGVSESSDAGVAVSYLRSHIAEQERATAEARELAELEAEAEALYRVYFETAEMDYKNWEKLEQRVKDYWLAVARRARELAKEATK